MTIGKWLALDLDPADRNQIDQKGRPLFKENLVG